MSTSPYDLYRSANIVSGKELDLRKEMYRLLHGASDEVAKGRYGLLRMMRRDSDGNLIRCDCRNRNTDEPDRDYYCRYCVTPFTTVMTENGIRYAKDIIPGMKVLSNDGNFHLITNTFARLYEGKMISIHSAGRNNTPLTVTADHPVFVLEKPMVCHHKKAKGKLCLPDVCCVSSCKTKTNSNGFAINIIEKRADQLQEGDYVITPRITESNEIITEINVNWSKYQINSGQRAYEPPVNLNIDEDLMFVLGWYVAEGSGSHASRKSRAVIFSLHKNKEQWVASRLLEIFKNKFGVEGTIRYKQGENSQGMQVVFHNALMSRWLHEICGRYSDHKKVPDFIWSASKEMQKIFLTNFMLGDGHRNNNDWETAGTVSKVLMEEVYIMATALGYLPSISFNAEYIGLDEQYHSDSWYVSWLDAHSTTDRQPNKWRLRFKYDNLIFSRVTKVEEENTVSAVYDFTVKDTHCFVADGLLVHNCIGMGYLWDEVKVLYYRDETSFREREGQNKDFEGDMFYVEYDVNISSDDYIITVTLDVDGDIQVPVERNEYFKILKADSMRADNGRIEFFAIKAVEERKWSTWYRAKLRR